VSLVMEHILAPKEAVDCFFTALQTAQRQVGTGYGNSISFYGGSVQLVCQLFALANFWTYCPFTRQPHKTDIFCHNSETHVSFLTISFLIKFLCVNLWCIAHSMIPKESNVPCFKISDS
jgi:hypothetical protein